MIEKEKWWLHGFETLLATFTIFSKFNLKKMQRKMWEKFNISKILSKNWSIFENKPRKMVEPRKWTKIAPKKNVYNEVLLRSKWYTSLMDWLPEFFSKPFIFCWLWAWKWFFNAGCPTIKIISVASAFWDNQHIFFSKICSIFCFKSWNRSFRRSNCNQEIKLTHVFWVHRNSINKWKNKCQELAITHSTKQS